MQRSGEAKCMDNIRTICYLSLVPHFQSKSLLQVKTFAKAPLFTMTTDTAILLIDPYNDFLHKDGKANAALAESLKATDTISHIHHSIKAARSHKIPIFYCLHQQTTPHMFKGWQFMTESQKRVMGRMVFEEGSWGAKFFEGMEPDLDLGDTVVSKHWNSR
jgi:nicotinamidase-related amidase